MQIVLTILGIGYGILCLLVMIEIFFISSKLSRIEEAIKAADKHRRAEFNALAD